ncbi:hypothetical protein UFOVP376_36 [uncultured Caudovirales phage]|uniref:Uncharacterized protein n=1 Tax=uncultured Caudovirales phage TaxID=2100421 RepID=A0A6J7X6S5_9CAUD|nr:hypothetical protein UFOVP376_36 [uncultured Caudovirales phage]
MATVYEYKGVPYELPDGLTNEAALARIKASLSETTLAPEAAIAQSTTPAQETAPSLTDQLKRQAGLAGRAVVQGLSAPANIVGDFLGGAGNLAFMALGSDRRATPMSQAQNRALTQVGFPEPATTSERAAQAGMQGLVSAGGMAAALPKTIFGADLVRQIPAATAAPMVAQPVSEEVKNVTGSDLAAFIVSVGVSGAVGQNAGRLADRIVSGKQPVTTMEQVRQNAQRAYTKVSDAGIKLTPENATILVDRLKTRLDAKDYIPENAAPVNNVLSKIESIAARGDVSFDNVEKMRSLSNTLKSNPDGNVRRLGSELIAGIDEHVASLKPRDVSAGAGGIDQAVKTIASARKDWRNMSRASTLENILDVAEVKALNPTASESEIIRQGFITLAANKKKMALFNEAERNAIKGVAKGSSLDPLLTLMSKFNPQRSQLIAAGGIGGGIASPESLMYTAPIAAGGFAADKLQALMRRRAGEQAVGGLLGGNIVMPAPSQYSRGLLSTLMTQQQD